MARDILGRMLVGDLAGVRVSGRIVEAEAYQEDDPASHSFRGPTRRNAVMFGPPGFLYVYFTYGMHFCMNVVTGRDGEGSAVLVRAIEPLEGIDAMAARRGTGRASALCSGPARLTQALGVARAENGLDLTSGTGVWLERGRLVADERVVAGPRVGIRLAVDRPWRFYLRDSPFVSRPLVARPMPPLKRPV